MKQKLYLLIVSGMILCTACVTDLDKASQTTETKNESLMDTDKEPLETEQNTEVLFQNSAESEKETQSLLPQQKRTEIDTFFNTGEFVYEPMLLEEVMLYLDEKGLLYEAYYDDGDVRINMTLEDGTSLIFLKTENIDGEYLGYALVMM